jgi:FkbM family methyltransferase
MLEHLASLIHATNAELSFTLLEIGALRIGDSSESFYQLVDLFPGSRVIGFEVDEDVCAEMNAKAKAGVRYFPHALGRLNERREFYVTEHPMCSSLYEPNEPLLSLYNNFEVAYLRRKTEIDTISLDYFAQTSGISAVDFIKMDIQGAELDVLQGGTKVLKSVLALVCEVEFIPHYVNQPLFGDVCSFLDQRQLMFHRFLGLGGRALHPITLNDDINFASQHIWSDAMYIRHVQVIPEMDPTQLLKLSVLAALYGSFDLSYYCLSYFDKRAGTNLAADFIENRGGS